MATRQESTRVEAAAGSGRQYLTFMLNGETFAIGILAIKEIIEYGNLTNVPMMPGFVRGVINLRGAVVPVIDLQARFGNAPAGISRRTCIVIIEIEADGEAHDVGIMVDAVNEVMEIPDSEVEAAPSFGTRIRTDFIRGMGKVDGRFVIILDLSRVVALEELAAVAAGAQQAVH